MEAVKISSKDILHFRKSWKSRVGCALFALLLGGGFPTLLALPGPKAPMSLLGWFCFGILETGCLAFAALFMYLSGPQYLSFDLNQRIYRYASGWLLRPQIREGPWEDIAGVYVWDRNSGRLSGYSVGIAWQDNKASRWQATLLGTFDGLGRLDRANRLAEDIASLLDVALVEPPFLKSTRTMS